MSTLTLTARAEWSRIWTVRSTWWFCLATLGVVLGIATIVGFDAREDGFVDDPSEGAWSAASSTGTFGMFVLLSLAAVLATADHATGGIVPTLQWTPRRGVLYAARSAVVVVTTTVLGVLLVLAGCLLVAAIVPGIGLPASVGVETLRTTGFVYVTGMLLAVGVGLVLRSTAGAVVSVLGLMMVLPMLLTQLSYTWARELAELLPGYSAISMIFEEGGLSTARSVTTLCVWALACLAAGAWRLLATDADR